MAARQRTLRVLMAVSERAAARMRRVFDGLEFERPDSLSQFSHALRCSPFDLVVVGCMFDGSRAIEAIKIARLHAPHMPLACVRAAPFTSALGEGTLAAFHAATEELGADCFVDLLQFPDDAEGNARVRTLLERLACVT
jgi:hypothetical protein